MFYERWTADGQRKQRPCRKAAALQSQAEALLLQRKKAKPQKIGASVSKTLEIPAPVGGCLELPKQTLRAARFTHQ